MTNSSQNSPGNESNIVMRLRMEGFRTSWLRPPERIDLTLGGKFPVLVRWLVGSSTAALVWRLLS